MVRGLYTAYTGMVNSQHRLDVVSNNLANATTTGYKKEGCTTQSFDAVYGIKIKDATVGHVNQNIGKLSLGAKSYVLSVVTKEPCSQLRFCIVRKGILYDFLYKQSRGDINDVYQGWVFSDERRWLSGYQGW